MECDQQVPNTCSILGVAWPIEHFLNCDKCRGWCGKRSGKQMEKEKKRSDSFWWHQSGKQSLYFFHVKIVGSRVDYNKDVKYRKILRFKHVVQTLGVIISALREGSLAFLNESCRWCCTWMGGRLENKIQVHPISNMRYLYHQDFELPNASILGYLYRQEFAEDR